jgi:hypothetical protein
MAVSLSDGADHREELQEVWSDVEQGLSFAKTSSIAKVLSTLVERHIGKDKHL